MPKVGDQKFPYTSVGVHQAQEHAKKTGQKVNMQSNYKKGGKVKKMNTGGLFKADGFHTEPWVNKDGYPSGGIPVKNK